MKYDYQNDDRPTHEEDFYCYTCDNQGFILNCCDDMCHGLGYCIHGDGEDVCPECEGRSAI